MEFIWWKKSSFPHALLKDENFQLPFATARQIIVDLEIIQATNSFWGFFICKAHYLTKFGSFRIIKLALQVASEQSRYS